VGERRIYDLRADIRFFVASFLRPVLERREAPVLEQGEGNTKCRCGHNQKDTHTLHFDLTLALGEKFANSWYVIIISAINHILPICLYALLVIRIF